LFDHGSGSFAFPPKVGHLRPFGRGFPVPPVLVSGKLCDLPQASIKGPVHREMFIPTWYGLARFQHPLEKKNDSAISSFSNRCSSILAEHDMIPDLSSISTPQTTEQQVVLATCSISNALLRHRIERSANNSDRNTRSGAGFDGSPHRIQLAKRGQTFPSESHPTFCRMGQQWDVSVGTRSLERLVNYSFLLVGRSAGISLAS